MEHNEPLCPLVVIDNPSMQIIILILIFQDELFEPRNVLEFADHLYIHNDYAAALNEYRRYQFLADSIPEEISGKIVNCLVYLERFDEAINEAAKIKGDTKRDFTTGWIFSAAGKYDSSRVYLNRVGVPYRRDAEKIMGFGYALEFRFSEAGEYIDLPDKKPQYKKPLLGAVCALFPGGGHIYCGRIGDGLFSFLIVSTSALLSYYYYDQEEDIKFGISLGAAILFYGANIYGGINAVHNYNYYQNEQYLREIEMNIGNETESPE